MRLIIFTLSALLAFAVAEREFHLQAKVEEVRRQVRACEAVRHWETPLPMDDQEQEPPMGQIDVSHILGYPTSTGPNTTRATHLGQKDIPGFHMLYAQANISKLHLTKYNKSHTFGP